MRVQVFLQKSLYDLFFFDLAALNFFNIVV
jgi:hypothetical protein